MKTAVIGSGAWGTALALALLNNGHQTTLWSYSGQEHATLREKRENPMLPGVALPDTLELTTDLASVKDCGAVVLATPSFAVRSTAKQLKAFLSPGAPVILVSKGIEKDTSLLLHQVVEQELDGQNPVVVLSGPSHAEEVGRGVPTAVVVACGNRDAALLAQDLFMSRQLRIYTSPDITGVEIGAALKNVIALCAGCCDGMGCGDNTKAMLMTRGLTEIARLGVALGAQQAMDELGGAVVEGYYAAASAKQMADKAGVEMPITAGAYEVLYREADPRGVLERLMARERRDELEEEQSWI